MTAKRHQRCDIQIEPGRSIKIVPEANKDQVNEKQLVDYREHDQSINDIVECTCGLKYALTVTRVV